MAASDIIGGEGVEATQSPPLKRIKEPPHISTTAYQESYYDCCSQADLDRWAKLHEGTDFSTPGVWRQV